MPMRLETSSRMFPVAAVCKNEVLRQERLSAVLLGVLPTSQTPPLNQCANSKSVTFSVSLDGKHLDPG